MKVITTIKDFVLSGYEEQAWEAIGPACSDFFNQSNYTKLNEPPRDNPMFFELEESEFQEMPILQADDSVTEEEFKDDEPETLSTEEIVEEAPINSEVVEAVKTESFADGFKQGIIEGRAAAEEEYNRKLAEIQENFAKLSADIGNAQGVFNQNLEKEALKLALQISKRILHTTVEARPEYIVEVIKRVFEESGVHKPLKIKMSPKDYKFVESIKTSDEFTALESSKVEFAPDATVKSGCTVETENGNLDLRIDNMWYEVAIQLGDIYK